MIFRIRNDRSDAYPICISRGKDGDGRSAKICSAPETGRGVQEERDGEREGVVGAWYLPVVSKDRYDAIQARRTDWCIEGHLSRNLNVVKVNKFNELRCKRRDGSRRSREGRGCTERKHFLDFCFDSE